MQTLKHDLDAMLTRVPELIDGLIEISQQKKWIESSLAVLRLSQCLVQALDTTADSLAQLPNFTDKEVKALKNNSKVKSLGDLLALDAKEQEKAIRAALSNADMIAEVLDAVKIMPHVKLTVKLFVEEEDEDDNEDDEEGVHNPDNQQVLTTTTTTGREIKGDQIYEGDLVTLRVTLDRNHQQGTAPTAVHAPFFPRTLYDNWWVLLTDKPPAGASSATTGRPIEPTLHAFEKMSSVTKPGKTSGAGAGAVTHEVRFMAPPHAGEYAMDLKLINDSYAGIDLVHSFVFTVLPASELPEYVPHPEDVELDNEPTLFEQVMAANVDDDDSSDEEEEGDDDDDDKAVQQKKKQQQQQKQSVAKGVVVEDADSEEGSDDE
jgi:translocation protein SEC63